MYNLPLSFKNKGFASVATDIGNGCMTFGISVLTDLGKYRFYAKSYTNWEGFSYSAYAHCIFLGW